MVDVIYKGLPDSTSIALADSWGCGNTAYARYIRIRQPASGILNLAEIQCWSSAYRNVNWINSASSATASSVYSAGGLSYPPSLLVDQSFNTFASTQAQSGGNEFFLVDLGAVQPVHEINVRNRQDCCQERANGMIVELLDGNLNLVLSFPPVSNRLSSTTFSDVGTNGYAEFSFYPSFASPQNVAISYTTGGWK